MLSNHNLSRWIVVFCGIQATAWTTAAAATARKNTEAKWFISVLMFRLIELSWRGRCVYSQCFSSSALGVYCSRCLCWLFSFFGLRKSALIAYYLFSKGFHSLNYAVPGERACVRCTCISSLYSSDFVRHQPRLISNTLSHTHTHYAPRTHTMGYGNFFRSYQQIILSFFSALLFFLFKNHLCVVYANVEQRRERKRGKNTPRNNHSQFGGMNELWNRFFFTFCVWFQSHKAFAASDGEVKSLWWISEWNGKEQNDSANESKKEKKWNKAYNKRLKSMCYFCVLLRQKNTFPQRLILLRTMCWSVRVCVLQSH